MVVNAKLRRLIDNPECGATSAALTRDGLIDAHLPGWESLPAPFCKHSGRCLEELPAGHFDRLGRPASFPALIVTQIVSILALAFVFVMLPVARRLMIGFAVARVADAGTPLRCTKITRVEGMRPLAVAGDVNFGLILGPFAAVGGRGHGRP